MSTYSRGVVTLLMVTVTALVLAAAATAARSGPAAGKRACYPIRCPQPTCKPYCTRNDLRERGPRQGITGDVPRTKR